MYERLLKSYLSIIIGLKEYTIPYAEYHPIVPLAVEIKTKISQIMKKLAVKEDSEEDQQALE
jgi:hypothetical protein